MISCVEIHIRNLYQIHRAKTQQIKMDFPDFVKYFEVYNGLC